MTVFCVASNRFLSLRNRVGPLFHWDRIFCRYRDSSKRYTSVLVLCIGFDMNDRTSNQIARLPLTDRDKRNASRTRRFYHVYLSLFFDDLSKLTPPAFFHDTMFPWSRSQTLHNCSSESASVANDPLLLP